MAKDKNTEARVGQVIAHKGIISNLCQRSYGPEIIYFIHSFNKLLLHAYYVSGTFWGPGNTLMVMKRAQFLDISEKYS